jgi:hypothetical protein
MTHNATRARLQLHEQVVFGGTAVHAQHAHVAHVRICVGL